MSTPPPLDADAAMALLAAAAQRGAGVHASLDGVTTLQAAQQGGAEPATEPDGEGGQP